MLCPYDLLRVLDELLRRQVGKLRRTCVGECASRGDGIQRRLQLSPAFKVLARGRED
jgi:hypothetical protein